MGNGCSRKTAVIEPMELPDKPKRLSPSIENLVESIIAERMEVHHQGIRSKNYHLISYLNYLK